jgi:hypothetical protein
MGVDEIALRDLGFGIRPPQAPVLPPPPQAARPQPRRPDSPPPRRTPPMRHPSPVRSRDNFGDRSPARHEPVYKRRAVSPPPPTRRYPPEKRWNGPRDRSPPPMAPVARQERAPPPPVPVSDRDGLSPALSWFVGILPNNRSFDGQFLPVSE